MRVGLLCCVFFGTVVVSDKVYGTVFDSDKYVHNLVLNDRAAVARTSTIYADNILFARSLYFANYGRVYGDIFVCDYCETYIKNSGVLAGTVHVSDTATLTRVITSVDDLAEIDIDGNYNVLISGVDEISINDIIDVGAGADKITLRDSVVSLDMFSRNGHDMAFELMGTVKVVLPNSDNLDGMRVFTNVSGDGTLVIDAPSLDPLYAYDYYMENGDVYIRRIRETDYYKILNSNAGLFLNDIRSIDPENKLIRALDRADNINEIHNIMSRSVLLNPLRLIKPVKEFNAFERDVIMSSNSGISISPEYVISHDFNIHSAHFRAAIDFGKALRLSAAIYAGDLEYSDQINDYWGALYGGNIGLAYNAALFEFNAVAGMTFADFDVMPVFHDDEIKIDLKGMSGYLAMRLGVPFRPIENLKFTPFVGIDVDRSEMFSETEFATSVRTGADVSYIVKTDDIRYDYNARLSTDTVGSVVAGISVGYFSEYDNMGGNIDVELRKSNFATTYKIRFGLDIKF